MKKQLISTLLVASALSFASAQTSTSTGTTTPVLPPPVTTGSSTIDAQIRNLNREMEARIKAIREEYHAKLKVLIGNRKALVASTTAQIRELKDDRKGKLEDLKNEIKDRREDRREDRKEDVRGTSTLRATTTKASPNGNAWGFFLRFFGQAKATSTQR